MNVPKKIEKELEELVGLSITDSGSDDLCRQIDKTCETITAYFKDRDACKDSFYKAQFCLDRMADVSEYCDNGYISEQERKDLQAIYLKSLTNALKGC